MVPAELVAQDPAPERDLARLLVLERGHDTRLFDSRVRELPQWLRPGDLLVVNETRVLRARLRGRKTTGGAAEALVLGPGEKPDCYRALLRCRGRQRVGQRFAFGAAGDELPAELVALGLDGEVLLSFPRGVSPFEVEAALIAHPSVLEAAVVPFPDSNGLIKPKAFVVLKERPNGGANRALHEELKVHVKRTIGPWKYPRWIEFVDSLPKTATGKIQRYMLRSIPRTQPLDSSTGRA